MAIAERSSRLAVYSPALSPDPREAVASARAMGFGGILFDAYGASLSIPELSQTGRREFRHTVAAQEIELVGLRGDIGPKGFGPGADIDRLLHQIDRALDAAAGLASPLLCLEIGPLAEPARIEPPKATISPEQAGLLILPTIATPAPPVRQAAVNQPGVDQPLMDSVNAALQELAARAERYSVTVAFRSSLAGFAALEHAVLSARCPWFGVDLDPAAMLSDEWEADEIFSRLGHLLRHVTARDAIKGADHRTRPAVIGQGSVDWAGLLTRLDESGYRSWITIDPTELSNRTDAARAGLEALRR